MLTLDENTPRQHGEPDPANPLPDIDWADLVACIQQGRPEAMERLYAIFGRGIRFYLTRQLGAQDIEDKIHDIFIITLNAIRRGDLREPERLMGFVRTIARRLVASQITRLIEERREHSDVEENPALIDRRVDPEAEIIHDERVLLMRAVLEEIAGKDREILTRFYLYEQPQEQICREMKLTDTQFRLLKSRAKARFGELGRKRLEQNKNSGKNSLRKSAGASHS
jgi:RNA polymerase sigma-70 factor, ECF subfamily